MKQDIDKSGDEACLECLCEIINIRSMLAIELSVRKDWQDHGP